MADTWKGLRRIAEDLEYSGGPYILRTLERELLPLLEAAETATEICDEDDNCKACQLRTALKRLREGQP